MKRLMSSKVLRTLFILGFGAGCAVAGAAVTHALANKDKYALTLDAIPLSVHIALAQKHTCQHLSPPIRVNNVPGGTTRLEVSVTDLNIMYDHGGGTVALPPDGQVAEGALDNYLGPCPGRMDHTYRFRVNALDAAGRIIGIGEVARPCCSTVPSKPVS